MPKRTTEQAIRDEWKAADKAVKDAKAKEDAAKAATKAAMERQRGLAAAHQQAIERRKRIERTLETYLAAEITGEEVSDGESAAPAATGAIEEVQPDGEDAAK